MTSPAQQAAKSRVRASDRRVPSLQGWLTTVLAVLALMVVGTGALGAALLSHTTTAGNRLVDGILPAQRDALRLETALLDQETGVRGYLLAEERALLEPYERGLVNERKATERLATVLDGEAGVRGDLAAVEEAARVWRDEFAIPAITSVDSGSPPPSLQAGKDASTRSAGGSPRNKHAWTASSPKHAPRSAKRAHSATTSSWPSSWPSC